MGGSSIRRQPPTLESLSSTFATVVDAGTDLNTARPAGAALVWWKFDAGTVVGADGANIVNAQPGDPYSVASA